VRDGQATGVEVKEVRGRAGETTAVRRLALNRQWEGGASSPRPSLVGGPEPAEEGPEGEMLVKLMTSESDKSHGSMMLRSVTFSTPTQSDSPCTNSTL
jgi:hypothetical protein